MTNVPSRLNDLKITTFDSILKSDHSVLSLDIIGSTRHRHHNQSLTFDSSPLSYSKMNRHSTVEYLDTVFNSYQFWHNVYDTSPQIFWGNTKQVILESCRKFIPKANISLDPLPRWFNSDIRHQLNKLKTVKPCIRAKPTPYLATKLSHIEHLLASKIETAKEDYIANLTSIFRKQPKKLYSYINSLSKIKTMNSLTYNGISISMSNPKSLVLAFNNLEKIVYDKIIDFVREKISKCQHCFLKNRSCLSQLISSYAYIKEQLVNNCAIDVVYLDFKKAFDIVQHKELLYKLWKL